MSDPASQRHTETPQDAPGNQVNAPEDKNLNRHDDGSAADEAMGNRIIFIIVIMVLLMFAVGVAALIIVARRN